MSPLPEKKKMAHDEQGTLFRTTAFPLAFTTVRCGAFNRIVYKAPDLSFRRKKFSLVFTISQTPHSITQAFLSAYTDKPMRNMIGSHTVLRNGVLPRN
ncbi:hypothetical protein DSM101010T_36630 [Desulfovibrio subterraneus]|uniref:Uncharacterized protein n=1 Tax=Desulfovibrio subterraneus TaxID=2718620 RepID=A0A7J0BNW0_9BACT|nr:hypothetical protein DSM101010T_36630 [Desulfovibrio subterraneus]